MRVSVSHKFYRWASTLRVCLILGLVLVASRWLLGSARAQGSAAAEPGQTEPGTTLVIFADRRMEDQEWTALSDALHRSALEAAETQAIVGTPEVVRGDRMEPGLQVKTVVVVFLHGDCRLVPLAKRTAFGVPLGWVRRMDGHIEPFVHLDCTRIGQVLGAQARGLDLKRRNAMMTGAMARVILHEWIHFATQSSAHSKIGISKAQFGVADLMADGSQPVARLGSPW